VNLSTPIGPTRAAWLLVRLRLARLRNQLLSGLQRFRRKSASDGRGATASKSKLGWFIATFVAVCMLFSFTNLAHQALSHMQDRLGSTALTTNKPLQARTGWLGVQTNDLTIAEAQALGWDQPRGAKVVASIPGGPAAKAGLLPGDILIAIDERTVANPGSLMEIVATRPPGIAVQLQLLRGGNAYRIAVMVGQRPSQPAHTPLNRIRLPPAAGYTLSPGVLLACALEAMILLVAVLLISLASREFAGPDWDLEWLVTFPVSFTTLLGVRIVERTLVNPAGLLALWPFLTIVAWECGYRIGAPLVALAVTMPLLVIAATIWTVVDTGLRLRVDPPKLRNLQAIVSVASVAFLYLAMSAGLSAGSYILDWAPRLPPWSLWLPPGLAVGVLASAASSTMAVSLLGLVMESMVCTALGFVLVNRQLRFGVVGASGRESRGRKVAPKPTSVESKEADFRTFLSPIQAREIRLLSRDRNFMVQTLILPAVIMGGQVFFNAPGNAFAFAFANPQHVSAAAFGIAAYALMFSAFQTLNAEGQALWILYTVPHALAAVLREKALLWGSVCLVYAATILSLGIALHPAPSLHQLELTIVVLLGVPIFATIGTSLGVFACDPLAQQVQRRVRASYVYLYMLLASLYVYAIYASNFWQRAALVVLSALLGLALWQKARDHLPYLLDPTASPPARVSVADGMMAALLFFVLQGLVALPLMSGGPKLTGRIVLIAFAVAGATTYAAMRFIYWRLKTQGVPRTLDPRLGRAVAWGVAGGSIAAVAAFIYLKLAAHTSLFDNVRETIFTGRDGMIWLALLAVGAAPIFEEFIFRGLIFGGLRRLLGLTSSVLASAAIFALVHPPPAVIPVFGLGVAAALVYERTGFLLGPMMVHAVYNAAIVTYQALF
jgi:ABC-2 type transport system permease protein